MRTSKYIKLHNRCIVLCELIDECTKEIDNYILPDLEKEKKRPWVMQVSSLIDEYESRLKKYTAIKQRLIKWYSDVFERLQSETHEFRTPDWLKEIDKVNIGTLQDEAPNALSEFTTEMDADEENERFADIWGGVRHDG